MADLVDAMGKIPDLNCIVTISNWNGYTQAAKEHGIQNQVGVFLFSELMGALNRYDHWAYVKHDEDGRPSTTTKADLSGRLFVFGSWLSSQTPKDLDLVFVYDQSICSPQDAISVRRALIRCGARLGLPPIHVVLLSETESSQCRFIELEGAILLQKWADERCDDLLRRLISETEHFL